MATINTNPGAMIALQNLNKTNMELEEVQQRINTGLKVASAKDDGGTFAIAQRMRADVAAFGQVTDSLNRAQSITDVSLSAGEAVSDLLIEMKEKALAASDASLDTASRTALNEDFKALRDQIKTVVDNAEFNGTNLINGSDTAGISALASADGTKTITVDDEDLTLSGSNLSMTNSGTNALATIDTVTNASNAVSTVGTALDNVNNALARLGTSSKRLEIQSSFVDKLSDSLTEGIGNLVDADLARESSRLQALQVKQQLGVQALSIANSAPSTVLGFFR